MPEVNEAFPQFDAMGPAELEAERRAIIGEMQTKYKGYDDPLMPEELLHKLALITSKLRKKNAGPPKATKAPSKRGPKATVDDLLI